MYKIGDIVMYGASGVMTVVDVRDESVGDVSKTYYVLGGSEARGSFTFVPVDNQVLVANMRPLMTVDQVNALIDGVESIPESDWPSDSRRRADYFKGIIDSADQRAIIGMIKAIDNTGVRRIKEGKKNYLSDENAMHKAIKLLITEFSTVLGIPEEDVLSFVQNKIKKSL